MKKFSLRMNFFILLSLFGILLAAAIYLSYNIQITNTYKKTMENALDYIKHEYPFIYDIDELARACGVAKQHVIDNIMNTGDIPPFNRETRQYEFVDDVDGVGSDDEYWAEIADIRRISESIKGMSMFYIARKIDGDKYQFVFSSGFIPRYDDEYSNGQAVDVEYATFDMLEPTYTSDFLGKEIDISWDRQIFTSPGSGPSSVELWGGVVAAYSPIVKNGKTIGVLGCDYNLSYILSLRHRSLIALIIAIVSSVIMSFLLSYVIANSIARPIGAIKDFVAKLAVGNFDVEMSAVKKDEFGAMQKSLLKTRDNLKTVMAQLKTESAEIKAMKDNLRYGVFLFNKDLIIQDNYSKALEQVLGTEEIKGRHIKDVMFSLFDKEKLKSVIEFLNMLTNDAVSQDKIDSLSPIQEFSYLLPNKTSRTEKILHSTFAQVRKQAGEIFVLCSLEDVTANAKLRMHLEKEKEKRQNEMLLFFEASRIDEKGLDGFLSKSEDNFKKVLETIRNVSITNDAVLDTIIPVINSVKSDAVAAGFYIFADKLDALSIKMTELQKQNGEISFDDMLRVTVQIEGILQEKDKLIKTIARLRSANDNKEKGQASEVLIKSLVRTCEKVSSDMDKKVSFCLGDFDEEAFSKLPRRKLKEILIQLVRNAVYHGIETPEECEKNGKIKTGVVTFSLVAEDGVAKVSLRDNGRGIDTDRIREKCIEQGLLSGEDLDNKQKLLQTIFMAGFSTAEKADMNAGRGVGLNLVYDRIKELGGKVGVQTTIGKGTTFTLSIPLSVDSADWVEIGKGHI